MGSGSSVCAMTEKEAEKEEEKEEPYFWKQNAGEVIVEIPIDPALEWRKFVKAPRD